MTLTKAKISPTKDLFMSGALEPENTLPRATPNSGLSRNERRYVKGSHESVKRLKANGFDPIDELVSKYRRLEKELEFYENWRDGIFVPLSPTGRTRNYNENSAANHLSIYDRLLKVADALLRYAYGRVPEGINLQANNSRPLIINLSKDEASYEILVNKQEEADFEDD
jgi:hypothetical protein